MARVGLDAIESLKYFTPFKFLVNSILCSTPLKFLATSVIAFLSENGRVAQIAAR